MRRSRRNETSYVISIFLDVFGLRIKDLQFMILKPYPSHSYPLTLRELTNMVSCPGFVAVTVFMTDKDDRDRDRGAAASRRRTFHSQGLPAFSSIKGLVNL